MAGAASGGLIVENLVALFSTEVQIPEARAFCGFKLGMDNIHSELLPAHRSAHPGPVEKEAVFNAISTMPPVQQEVGWAFQRMCKENSFAERFVAFAAEVGVLYVGSFFDPLLKKWGRRPGLTFSSELTYRDEGLHAVLRAGSTGWQHKLPVDVLHGVIGAAEAVVRRFIGEARKLVRGHPNQGLLGRGRGAGVRPAPCAGRFTLSSDAFRA
mmetsp:Transcript_74544/g.230372  ORF Transcript_74544/g.230372 Transcript_74544/m.230372 type:complete len:212 (-) Transcript_74544:151-786(-)